MKDDADMGRRSKRKIEPTGDSAGTGTSRHILLMVVLLGLLAAGVVAAFAPGLDGTFLNWDDDRNFQFNPDYRGLGAAQLEWAWKTYHLGVWQPLSWILLGAEYVIGGMDVRVYNTFSLLLHLANAFLLFFVMVRFVRIVWPRGGPVNLQAVYVGAATAAMLFSLHPLRVEAVAWKSCQPYLPAIFFYLLAVFWYVRRHDDTTPAWRWMRISVAFLLYVIAVMFKAVAVTLPVILLILDVWPLGRLGGKNGWFNRRSLGVLLEKVPFFLVALLVSAWATAAKDYTQSRVPLADFNADAQFAQSAYGTLFYLMKTLWPAGLHAYYRLPQDISVFAWPYAFCAILVLGVSVAVFVARRRVPSLLAAWVAYLLILLPNTGLVQFSQQIAADRYGYLALVPLFVLLAGALARLFSMKRSAAVRIAVAGLLSVACLVLIVKTRAQSRTWHDSEVLWQRVIDYDPDCAVAECNLGSDLLFRGEYREASRHLSRAVDLCEGFAFAYANFGTLLLEVGQYSQAIDAYSIALEGAEHLSTLDLAKVHAGIGEAYAMKKDIRNAWKHTVEARRLGIERADKMLEQLKPLLDAEGNN